MHRPIKLDLTRFPLLTPKAFALPEDKGDEKGKLNFLIGSRPTGIYGKDAQLAYDYRQPAFKTQFDQLIAAYRQLGQEIKAILQPIYAEFYGSNLPGSLLANIHKIVDMMEGKSIFSKIAETERGAAYRLFKEGMEDILFYMRTALIQAQTKGDAGALVRVKRDIASMLSRLDEAFTHCSEQTTETIMSARMQWTPGGNIAQQLLKRRCNLVDIVARQDNKSEDVHRGTAAYTAAHQQGYGVPLPQHTDPYRGISLQIWMQDTAPQALLTVFARSYTYESICTDVYTEFHIQCKKALQNCVHLESLSKDQEDTLRDALRSLLQVGVCQETDLFEAVPQTNGLVRINPNFPLRLSAYCARHTLLTLRQEGYVKDIGQLPVQATSPHPTVEERIRSFSASGHGTLDQWCASQEGETILTEHFRARHFFTVLALLSKFNPFQTTRRGDNLLHLVLTNPRSIEEDEEGKSKVKPLLQDWQQTLLLQVILQHPAATPENLTAGKHENPAFVAFECSYEIFTCYWDRLIAMYRMQSETALVVFMNTKDRRVRDKTPLAYAVERGEFAPIPTLAAIPGVDIKECLSHLPSYAKEKEKEKEKITSFISCLSALEEKSDAKAYEHFTQFVKRHTDRTRSEKTVCQQMMALLKSRYGKPSCPHHVAYQGFLLYLATQERNLENLLLKRENSSIDLDQPRLLRLNTGQEVKETPLRAAIRENDEQTLTLLLDEVVADPDIEVEGESAWLLIANSSNGLSSERQLALLQLFMDKSSSELNLEEFLLQLVEPQRTEAVFYYILKKLQKDPEREYHKKLGEFEVEGKEFVKGIVRDKKEKIDPIRDQQLINAGREESKADPEVMRLTIATQLGAVLNKLKNAAGHSVLYQLVSTHQAEKMTELLLETAGLDFSAVFTIPGLMEPEQKSREVKHAPELNPVIVKNLVRLIHALQQKPAADYKTAHQCFADLYALQKNLDYYKKLLTIISNHCPNVVEFCKSLAATEKNVICLQRLRKYVPINLLTTVQYAAQCDCSAELFNTSWREAIASLTDVSQGDSILPLESLVKNLLTIPDPQSVDQQYQKLLLVLKDFPMVAHLEKYYRGNPIQQSNALDYLIRLLMALEQGDFDGAITYYLIGQQQKVSDTITIAEPLSSIITRQWGGRFFDIFSQRLRAQASEPTGFMQIRSLMLEGVAGSQNKASHLLLRQTESGQLPSHDLLANLHLLLQLHFIGENKPWHFALKLWDFFRHLLSQISTNVPLQCSIIVYLISLDTEFAASRFGLLLYSKGAMLLPEKLLQEKWLALQEAIKQKAMISSSSPIMPPEFFSYILGQIFSEEDFRGYDQFLTEGFTALAKDQPFCQGRDTKKTIIIVSPIRFALETQHYKFLETVLAASERDKLLATDAMDKRAEPTYLLQMVEIKDSVRREKIVRLWLASGGAVRVEAVDARGNNAFMKALQNDDEKTALHIWNYALQVFRDDPEKLKKFANQKNSEGKTAFSVAREKGYHTLALLLLESVTLTELDRSNPSSKTVGFSVDNIIGLVQGISGEAINWFFSCVDRDEKTTEFNTEQVIRIARMVGQQSKGYYRHSCYQELFFNLLIRYSHNKEVVSALLQTASQISLVDILKMAMGRANVALATIILEQAHAAAPAGSLFPDIFYDLFGKSYFNMHDWGNLWVTPGMSSPLRHAFLDLFLSHGAHQDKEQKLIPAVKARVIESTCYFTTFLQIFSYDHHNELLTFADHKELSSPKKDFLSLVKALLTDSADSTALYLTFKHLLSLIEDDVDTLPMVLDVLKKKLSQQRVSLFLTSYLASEKVVTSDPESYLLTQADQARSTQAETVRALDAKGAGSPVLSSKFALSESCSFVTFLTILQKAPFPYRGHQVTSELSTKKSGVLQMLAPRGQSFRELEGEHILAYLALSLNEQEFKAVWGLLQRSACLQRDVECLLSDERRLTNIYQKNPARLQDFIQYFLSLHPLPNLPNKDSVCHLFIRYGFWDLATQFLPRYLMAKNSLGETPFTVALKTLVGDAKQRQDFFRAMAKSEDFKKELNNPKTTLLMQAAESPCDIACFREVLSVCDAKTIGETLYYGASCEPDSALIRAASTNQPEKVDALLETKAYRVGCIDALIAAGKKDCVGVIKIFWKHDKDHELKFMIKKYYACNAIEFSKMVSEALYLLHKDGQHSIQPIKNDHVLEVLRHYGDYSRMLSDEKSFDRTLDLLVSSGNINAALFSGISLLTYALQNKEPGWLVPKLFQIPTLHVSGEQVRLIYHNAELKPYLFRALRFFCEGRADLSFSLIHQLYSEAPDLESGTRLIEQVVDISEAKWPNAHHKYQCAQLLVSLAETFARQRDTISFCCLFRMIKNSERITLGSTKVPVLIFAIQHRWPELIAELAKINDQCWTIKNDLGQTPLEVALLGKDKPTVHAVLDAKASAGFAIWPMAEDGRDSVLMLAVLLGDLAMCQKIGEHAQQECKEHFAAFLNHKNAAGKSALYLAAEGQQEAIVRWLLSLPGIDSEAYCTTTHRTAALCSYQQAQLQPQPPSVQQSTAADRKVEVKADQAPPSSEPGSAVADRKVEVKAEQAPSSASAPSLTAGATSTSAAGGVQPSAASAAVRTLQVFTEHKLVNPQTVAVDHPLADTAQYLSWGQHERAVQTLLPFLKQQDCDQLDIWLPRLFTSRSWQPLEDQELFVVQLAITALRKAATHSQYLPLFSDIFMSRFATSSDFAWQDIRNGLQQATILFSEATLDALLTDEQLKSLWPAAVLAYARACASRPQQLEAQLALIKKIMMIIARLSPAELTQSNAIFANLLEAFNAAQQQFLLSRAESDNFPVLHRQIKQMGNEVLRAMAVHGHMGLVKAALTHSEVRVGKDLFYLVDVNMTTHMATSGGADNSEAEPLVFTVLQRAQQEQADEKDESKAPFCAILKLLIDHCTWQDTRRDSQGCILLMRALSAAPNSIFVPILMKTRVNTWILPIAGRTVMDWARPDPKPGKGEDINQLQLAETNKYANAQSLAKNMREEFNRCLKQIADLQGNVSAKIKDLYGNPLDLSMLRAQACGLALELLKFDALQAERLPKNSLVYSSFLSAIPKQTLLQDIQDCQNALRSGQPLGNEDLTERAAKLPQFFIQQFVAAWNNILPPQPQKTATDAARQQASPSGDHRPTLLNFSKSF